MYGPTTGDRIRLADTDLLIEVTEDWCGPGDEAVFGGGKTVRESMAQSTATHAQGTPDLVITGAVILDHWGVVKADVGIRDGRIVALGKAGNPDISDGIHPQLVIGPSTEILSGNGCILTAGGIDCHVHLICPQIVDEAVGSGLTTLIGGGTGPAEGTKATTVTPGAWNLARMLTAMDGLPVNVALLGKGNTASPDALWEQLRAGASGFKLHEDWGSTPAAINTCLTSPTRPESRSPCTPTPSTKPATWPTPSPPSQGGRSTRTTPRGRAAATRRTSSWWRPRPTSCPRPPTRRCPTPSTPSTSTSTC